MRARVQKFYESANIRHTKHARREGIFYLPVQILAIIYWASSGESCVCRVHLAVRAKTLFPAAWTSSGKKTHICSIKLWFLIYGRRNTKRFWEKDASFHAARGVGIRAHGVPGCGGQILRSLIQEINGAARKCSLCLVSVGNRAMINNVHVKNFATQKYHSLKNDAVASKIKSCTYISCCMWDRKLKTTFQLQIIF